MKRVSTLLKTLPQVQNFTSHNGNDVPNQYEIRTQDGRVFQSYSSIIAIVTNDGRTIVDTYKYDYSKTTMKYLCDFLRLDSIKEVRALIDSGSILTANLNK